MQLVGATQTPLVTDGNKQTSVLSTFAIFENLGNNFGTNRQAEHTLWVTQGENASNALFYP